MNRRSFLQAIVGAVASLTGLPALLSWKKPSTHKRYWFNIQVPLTTPTTKYIVSADPAKDELAMKINSDGHLLRVYWMPSAGQCDAATEVWRRS